MPRPKQKDGFRLMPWADWAEWLEVKDMVESGRTTDAKRKLTTFMLRRSSAVPIAMISTISLMHQLENPSPDPYTNRLALSMTITRLVNGTTDQFQPRGERSVARSVAYVASELGMPLELVEIRHQACHNELPNLSFLRFASKDALAWLKDWYWEPQLRNIWPYVKHSSYVLTKKFKGEVSPTERELLDSEPKQPPAREPVSIILKRSDDRLEKVKERTIALKDLLNKREARPHAPLVSMSVKDWGSRTFGLLPGQRWVASPSQFSAKRNSIRANANGDKVLRIDDIDSNQDKRIAHVNYSAKSLLADEINDANVVHMKNEKGLSENEKPLFLSKMEQFQLVAAKAGATQRQAKEL